MAEELSVTLARIDERQKELTVKVDHIETKVDEIEKQAQRWKGAFVVILVLGGFVGWILSQAVSVKRLFGF